MDNFKEQMQIPESLPITKGVEDTASLRRHVKSLREELLYCMDMNGNEMEGMRAKLLQKDQVNGELAQKISDLESQLGASQTEMERLKGELAHEKKRNLIGGWLLKGATDAMKRSYAKKNHLDIDQLRWNLVTRSDGRHALKLRIMEVSETDGEARNESSTSSGTGTDEDGGTWPVPVGGPKLPLRRSSSVATDLSNMSSCSSASSLFRPVLIQRRKRKRSGSPKPGPTSAPLARRQRGLIQPGSGKRRCLCGEPFENLKPTRRHIAGHCLICDRAFGSQRELKEHRCNPITDPGQATSPTSS